MIASRPFGVSTTRIETAWPSERPETPAAPRIVTVDEHVLAKVVAGDESEASRAVKPLDLAGQIDRRSTRRGSAVAAAVPAVRRRSWRRPRSPAPPARPREPEPNDGAKLRARGQSFAPDPAQGLEMHESVASAARLLDEAIALLGVEPLHRRLDRQPTRQRICASRRTPRQYGLFEPCYPSRQSSVTILRAASEWRTFPIHALRRRSVSAPKRIGRRCVNSASSIAWFPFRTPFLQAPVRKAINLTATQGRGGDCDLRHTPNAGLTLPPPAARQSLGPRRSAASPKPPKPTSMSAR